MADNKPELQRGLEARHIELIALGGTIGVGLFMGAASTLKWAGPSVFCKATEWSLRRLSAFLLHKAFKFLMLYLPFLLNYENIRNTRCTHNDNR